MSNTLTSAQVGGLKRTKKYQALKNLGWSDAQVLSYLQPVVSNPVADLIAAGIPADEAARIVGGQFATPTAVAETVKVALTSKEQADALVAQHGFTHTKGRVYATGSILEAAARVLKGGKPEVVTSSGVGRTKAVVIFRESSGDVAIQNLTDPVG